MLSELARLGAASFSGYTSIGFWILVQVCQVYLPQIYENFSLQSGEGLSLMFVLIWLAGDLANFFGALWQNLLPTVIYLALYYTFCDIVLLFQLFYYRRKRQLHPINIEPVAASDATEQTALLPAKTSDEATAQQIYMARWRETAIFVLGLGFVLAVGGAGYILDRPTVPKNGRSLPSETWDDKAQIVGWISAILFASRIPQIMKNRHSKCEGLSLMFFFFALFGNLTFSASLLIPSLSAQHLIINLSWLVGSLGTVFLDLIVIAQFSYYAKDRAAMRQEALQSL